MGEVLYALNPDFGMNACQRILGGGTLILALSVLLNILWIVREAIKQRRKDDL